MPPVPTGQEKATTFSCGVCSVSLPVLQNSTAELLEIDSKLHFLIVVCVVV